MLKWTKKFPKRGCVGYYWFRSELLGGLDDGVIVEVSGGAPNVPQVVYLSGEMLAKREFIKRNGEGEFYGPIQPPE